MNERLSISIILVLVFCPFEIAASDGNLAEDVFRWFPRDRYWSVFHIDKASTLKEEAGELFFKMVARPWNFDPDDFLPPGMRGGYSTYTMAYTAEMQTRLVDVDKLRKLGYNIDGEEQGKLPYATDRGESLEVFEFDVLDTLIDQGLREGRLAETEHFIDGRPLYTFTVRIRQMDCVRYAYATVSQELLVTENVRTLYRMAAAGLGIIPGLLDDEDTVELTGYIPELGQFWCISSYLTQTRNSLDWDRQRGMSEQYIKEREEKRLKQRRFKIETYFVSDNITFKVYDIFGSEEEASKTENYYARVVQSDPPWWLKEFYETLAKKRKDYREGAVNIMVVEFDNEMMEVSAKKLELIERAKKERSQTGESGNSD